MKRLSIRINWMKIFNFFALFRIQTIAVLLVWNCHYSYSCNHQFSLSWNSLNFWFHYFRRIYFIKLCFWNRSILSKLLWENKLGNRNGNVQQKVNRSRKMGMSKNLHILFKCFFEPIGSTIVYFLFYFWWCFVSIWNVIIMRW